MGNVWDTSSIPLMKPNIRPSFRYWPMGLNLFPVAVLVLLVVLTQSVMAQTNDSARSATNALSRPDATSDGVTWLGEWLKQFEWLQIPILGNPLWQYVAALLYIVVAFYASKFVDFMFRVQLKRLTAKTSVAWDDLLVDLVRGPVKVITFVILLHLGLRGYAWPDWAARFISNGQKIVVAASITYVANKFVD